MAGGTHTTEQREAAIAAAARLLDLGTPSTIITVMLQRDHGYSRAQAFRLLALAGEQRGKEGIRARPSGSELIEMSQQALGLALASAVEGGDWQAVAKLGKELRESLKANGSVTTAAPPDPDELAEQVQQTRIANRGNRTAPMRSVSSETDCGD